MNCAPLAWLARRPSLECAHAGPRARAWRSRPAASGAPGAALSDSTFTGTAHGHAFPRPARTSLVWRRQLRLPVTDRPPAGALAGRVFPGARRQLQPRGGRHAGAPAGHRQRDPGRHGSAAGSDRLAPGPERIRRRGAVPLPHRRRRPPRAPERRLQRLLAHLPRGLRRVDPGRAGRHARELGRFRARISGAWRTRAKARRARMPSWW